MNFAAIRAHTILKRLALQPSIPALRQFKHSIFASDMQPTQRGDACCRSESWVWQLPRQCTWAYKIHGDCRSPLGIRCNYPARIRSITNVGNRRHCFASDERVSIFDQSEPPPPKTTISSIRATVFPDSSRMSWASLLANPSGHDI
jgi:hypothetical protein